MNEELKVSTQSEDFDVDKVYVYVTTYKKYNEGRLDGEWLCLNDFDNFKDFYDKCMEIHSDEEDPEFLFADAMNFPFDEIELNGDAIFEYVKMDEYDRKRVKFLVKLGYDMNRAVSEFEDVIFYEGKNLVEVAEELVGEGCYGDIPESIINYIDYEKIAYDLEVSGEFYETDDGVFMYV